MEMKIATKGICIRLEVVLQAMQHIIKQSTDSDFYIVKGEPFPELRGLLWESYHLLPFSKEAFSTKFLLGTGRIFNFQVGPA